MGAAYRGWPVVGAGALRHASLACVLLAILLAFPGSASAQRQDFALMRSEIADEATLVVNADMDFGDILPNAAGGLVVMTPSAAAVCSTTGGLVRTGVCKAAEFTGTAFQNASLRVRRPNGNRIDLTGPGGATMRLDAFTFGATGSTSYDGNTGANHHFTVGAADGSFVFHVGGTLHVGANQAPGRYNGTFAINLDYN